MKTLNTIVKTITALCIMAMFFSCSIYEADEHGTLLIQLPGSDSARAAVTDFTELKYRIECDSSYEKVSRDADSGAFVSIPLSPGEWTVTLTVLDAKNNKIGGSEPKKVLIKSGKPTNVSMDIALDQYPYFGDTLYLSGLVYGGASAQPPVTGVHQSAARVLLDYNAPKVGEIKEGGQLSCSIGKPEILQQMFTEDSEQMIMLNSLYKNLTLTSQSVQGASLSLHAISEVIFSHRYFLKKEDTTESTTNITVNGTSVSANIETYECVKYLYLENDVTITGNGKKDPFLYEDILSTSSDLNLKLKKGWNAVYMRRVKTYSGLSYASWDIFLSNPDIKWWLQNDGW